MPSSAFTKDYKRFRTLLVEVRQKAGLTQAQLAKRLSKPQSFVSKMERGERRIDVVEFDTVARALGADPIRLLKRFYSECPDEDCS